MAVGEKESTLVAPQPRGVIDPATGQPVGANDPFIGDINMSAIKRDVGVKDGSTILPGMGGIIDRVDSLTFTAPAAYYYFALAN